MGKRKDPYVIMGEEFKTLQDLRERVRAIRDAYPDNVFLNPQDLAFMCALLQRHESADLKFGCGVAAMYVKTDEIYKNNRCFWLMRKDGTESDFSFEMCLRNKPMPRLIKFKMACRTAVGEEMCKFKYGFFTKYQNHCAICPITGEIIMPKQSHVDHMPPWTFDRIVLQFIQDFSIDIEQVQILGIGQDKATQNSIADEGLKQQFIRYHNERAQFRVISQRANLSIVKTQAV